MLARTLKYQSTKPQICTHSRVNRTTHCMDTKRTHTNTHSKQTDTEGIYENMVGDISRSFNIPYRYDVRMRILGTTETMTAKLAVNELRLPISVDEFKVRFAELGRQRLGNAPLLQGWSDYCHETDTRSA